MTETEELSLDVEQTPLTNWKKEPTLRELKQDYTDATPHHDGQVAKITEWLDNLNCEGKAKIKTPDGHSEIVPKLIRKQAEWRYAALSEPFLSTDDVFNVSPVTYEDREAAVQNQLVLNHQFNNKIQKVTFIDEYVRTAVDEGTVVVRVGWDFEEEQYEEDVQDFEYVVDPAAGPQLQQLMQMQQQDPQRFEQEVPDELKQALEMTQQYGQPISANPVGSHKETKTRTVKNCPTLEICDYRNVVIDPTALGDIDKASFVIYNFETSRSALEKDGRYKNLDQISSDASVLAEPDHATTTLTERNFNFKDKPRKKIVVHEYWGYRDINGTGIVEPFVAAWVGNTLIRMEANPFPDKKLPFVVVPYLPVRKNMYGEPDGALLEDNQRIIGAVTRGMIDIMARSANGQTGVRKDALDITNKRKYDKGQDYEFNANVDPRQAFFMHTYPEIPQSASFMLQLQNMEAESLTGVKSFSQGVSGQSLGDVAAGVRGALDAASKRELGILRRLSQGIVTIGRKFISMNSEFLSDEEVVRITNDDFIKIRRDDLSGEFDLKLSISTAEEDNNKAEQLAFMLQTMGNNMDPEMSRMILADIANLRKMPSLAKKIEEYQPQPDPVAQQIQQLEMAKLQAEVELMKADAMERQAKAQLDMAKIATEQAKAGDIQSGTDLKNLDFVEQESGTKQERDMQKVMGQSQGNKELLAMKQQHEAVQGDQDRKVNVLKEMMKLNAKPKPVE